MPDKHEVPGSIPGYPKEPFEKKVYKVHWHIEKENENHVNNNDRKVDYIIVMDIGNNNMVR